MQPQPYPEYSVTYRNHIYPTITFEFLLSLKNNVYERLTQYKTKDDLEAELMKFPLNIDVSFPTLKVKLEANIVRIMGKISGAADKITTDIITPWTIEKAKIVDATKLFFPIRETLPIIVKTRDGKSYTHECTEELILGILSVTSSFLDKFNFYFEDIVEYEPKSFIIDYVAGNYTKKTNGKYSAVLSIGKVYFDTIDVIQGVITGASWLNEDPHKYISDIFQDGIKVDF